MFKSSSIPLKKIARIQKNIGIFLSILCFLICIFIGLTFYNLKLETKIGSLSVNIPLIVVISITLLLCLSTRIFYLEKNNIYKEFEFDNLNSKSNLFIKELEDEIKSESNNLSIQNINFNYIPEHIETLRFLVGTFFILGLAGSFSGIAEVVSKVTETLTNMSSSSSDNINLSNALSIIKKPLEPLKTVFLVTILGLINALVVENLLQVLYKKISYLEFEITKKAREKVSKLLINKDKILTNIDQNLIKLNKQSEYSLNSIKDTIDNYCQTLFISLNDSGEKFIDNFNNSNDKLLSNQISMIKDLKNYLKKDNEIFYNNISDKFEDLNIHMKSLLINQENLYENTKIQLNSIFESQNKSIIDVDEKIMKHIDFLSNKNEELVKSLEVTIENILNIQKNVVLETRSSLEQSFNDLIIDLSNKSELIKVQLINSIEYQKKFYNQAIKNHESLYKLQNEIIEKHNTKIDEYYNLFQKTHENYINEINNKINIINNDFQSIHKNIEPIINLLDKSSKLIAKVEDNLAGLGNRNDSILENLNKYLVLTEDAINNNKYFISNISSFLNAENNILTNQKNLTDNISENIQRLNELSSISLEYQRKIDILKNFFQGHINEKNASEAIN